MFKATVDRLEGDFAILSLDDGQKIRLSKEELPLGIKEGSVVWLSVFEDQEATTRQRELAKEILNEILKMKE